MSPIPKRWTYLLSVYVVTLRSPSSMTFFGNAAIDKLCLGRTDDSST